MGHLEIKARVPAVVPSEEARVLRTLNALNGRGLMRILKEAGETLAMGASALTTEANRSVEKPTFEAAD